MYPHERSLIKQLAGLPFEIIGVNSDDDASLEELKGIYEEENITWRSFRNMQEGGAEIANDWGIQSWPSIFILDPEGVIRFKNVHGEKLDEAITALLEECGHEVEIVHEEEDESENHGDDQSSDDNER